MDKIIRVLICHLILALLLVVQPNAIFAADEKKEPGLNVVVKTATGHIKNMTQRETCKKK